MSEEDIAKENVFGRDHLGKRVPVWGHFVRSEVDESGEHQSTVVDVRLIFPPDQALRSRCTRLVTLETPMLDGGEDGVGSPETIIEDMDRVQLIANTLQEILERELSGIFVGYRRQKSTITFYVYLPPSNYEHALRRVISLGPANAEYQFGIAEDPEWSIYRHYLYPCGAMDSIQIYNWEIIRELRERNEDFLTAHNVQHFVFLPRGDAQSQFLAWAARNGFEIHADISPSHIAPSDHEAAVCLVREEASIGFHDINEVMFPLILETEKWGGRYLDCQIEPKNAVKERK